MSKYTIQFKANDSDLTYKVEKVLKDKLGYIFQPTGSNNAMFMKEVYWASDNVDVIWIDWDRGQVGKQRGTLQRGRFFPDVNITQSFDKSELKVLDMLGFTIMPHHAKVTGQDITDWF